MTDLITVVPSRGRPHTVPQLVGAFTATCRGDTELVVVVDKDDPTLGGYLQATHDHGVRLFQQRPGTMVTALNFAAGILTEPGPDAPFAVGFMGDDHRPCSDGWDTRYVEELRRLGAGFVYGDDLIQGPNIPTQCAMTTDVVRALGWMAPPFLRHLWVDNAWLELGRAVDRISYLPEVVVEHLHPIAGRTDWDEGYRRVNAGDLAVADRAAFDLWRHGPDFVAAVAALRGLL